METYELGRHADPISESSRLTELMTKMALERVLRKPAPSAMECDRCGVEIPEKRRLVLESIGGTRHCVDCASHAESSGRHYNNF